MIGFKILSLYNKFLQYLGKHGVFEDIPYPDVLTNFPQAKIFENNFSAIRDEYLHYLKLNLPRPTLMQLGLHGGNNGSTLPWNDYSTEKKEEADWTTVFLKLDSKIVDKNSEYFPKTVELLKSMPNVVNVFFSQLGPQSTIEPHYGYMKGFLRYHLGLIIPDDSLCYLEVDGSLHYWKPGGSVVFDDMFLHAAYNKSNQVRVILFVDFYRPLPFPYDWMNRKIANLLMKNKFVKKAEKIINNF